MKFGILFLTILFITASALYSFETNAFTQNQKLGKGMNLGYALEAPDHEGAWGVVLKENYFNEIARKGFNTVRVPIRWSDHAAKENPYKINDEFFKRVDWVVYNCLVNSLNVVLDFHHYDEFTANPDQELMRFYAIWVQLATRFRSAPDTVYFELLNEPSGSLTADRWNEVVKNGVKLIRTIDKRRTIIINPAEGGSLEGLVKLELPANEKNLIVDVHYFNPKIFTLQMSDRSLNEYSTSNIVWPGPPSSKIEPSQSAELVAGVKEWFSAYNSNPAEKNPAGLKEIQQDLDKVSAWGQKYYRPIWIGEFGVTLNADKASRVKWTKAVRTEAEKRAFSWSYWEFCADFGAYNAQTDQWREEIAGALLND